jgi:hypothetical protein
MPLSSENDTIDIENSIPWLTESLRITIFGTVIPNTWKNITGADPAQSVKQSSPMLSFDAGTFHGGWLVVSSSKGVAMT